jgi:acetyl esterase/lipase
MLVLATSGAANGQGNYELKLWPDGVPGGLGAVSAERADELLAKNTDERISMVIDPVMTLWPAPADKANGCAVVVCPGGGYNILAYTKEGTEVAQWLNSLGVTAIVLKYRVPRRDPEHPYHAPLQDAQRAMRLVRKNAEQWKIDPSRIGILGFSAGGHLSVMTSTHWDETTYQKVDDADQLSSRPDFMIPVYAAYLGKKMDDSDSFELDDLVSINEKTPPAFMVVTYDDKLRGAHAGLMLAALKKAGVSAEAHIYLQGGHGYGLRPTDNPVSDWPQLCGEWMRASGLLEKSQ